MFNPQWPSLRNLRVLARTLGGARALAIECGVRTSSAEAWLKGARTPSPANRYTLLVRAEELGLPPPFPLEV